MTLKEIKGGAEELSLNAGINDSVTSFVTATTPTANWPTGTSPFVIIVGAGTANEEKMLVTTRSTSTFSGITRGYDGTVGVSHSAGAKVRHVIDADTVSEANAHVNNDARDDHSQYLNTARHDVEVRHAFGGALGVPSAPAAIGTAASAGAGDDAAREDHVHIIGAGAINSAGMFGAGVVDAAAIATDAVGTAEIATDAVGAAEIAAGAVGAAELATDAVTPIKIQADAVTTVKVLDANITAAKLAANAVTTAKITDANVTTAKILDANVTRAKIEAGYKLTFVGANAPSSPVEGELWYESDTDTLWSYDGATWLAVSDVKAKTNWTPILQQNLNSVAITGPQVHKYARTGPVVTFGTFFVVNSVAPSGGQIKFTLPGAADDQFMGGGFEIKRGGTSWVGGLKIQDGGLWVSFNGSSLVTLPTLSTGDTIAAYGGFFIFGV